MDNFEKHIKENKQLFDDYKPDKTKIWGNIVAELEKPEQKVIPLWKSPKIRVAASIVVFIGLFSIIAFSILKNTGVNEVNLVANKELQEIDMHYQGLVSYQVKLLENNTQLSPQNKVEFLAFMDELDAEYELLKLEMNENLDNALVLEAIIGNYKKRIELIENLLHQINNSKKIDSNEEYIL